ncbi:hypothetical protein L1987_22382 [Smallanthus sonchifolius]|uniref:Uncharacterized protein n=1 Tax=Smallanthus sonchifolius TaxID=185202 RepID=A0ACB9IEP2_9ASTR|nr:hypothetical protein L1987_22382 [Smallanthus sonchifolius]
MQCASSLANRTRIEHTTLSASHPGLTPVAPPGQGISIFKDVAEVVEVRFTMRDDRFVGYGHVEFATPDVAQKIRMPLRGSLGNLLNSVVSGNDFNGGYITIEEAKPRGVGGGSGHGGGRGFDGGRISVRGLVLVADRDGRRDGRFSGGVVAEMEVVVDAVVAEAVDLAGQA